LINWTEATPINSFAGGVLIGVAVSILILFNGKVAGISGILGGIIKFKTNDVSWRLLFLIGLLISHIIYSIFFALPVVTMHSGNLTVLTAGLLVGLGTRYGSGCTSGHGICGISRLSTRSIVATIIFMLAGIVTVYVTHHLV
jgi:uncharacterized membrane protein YedE/YeeE